MQSLCSFIKYIFIKSGLKLQSMTVCVVVNDSMKFHEDRPFTLANTDSDYFTTYISIFLIECQPMYSSKAKKGNTGRINMVCRTVLKSICLHP